VGQVDVQGTELPEAACPDAEEGIDRVLIIRPMLLAKANRSRIRLLVRSSITLHAASLKFPLASQQTYRMSRVTCPSVGG
jgi:hypothetical protein